MNELETLKSMHTMLGALIAAKELSLPQEPGAQPTPNVPPGHHYMPKTGRVLPPVEDSDYTVGGYMLRNFAALGLPYPPSFRLMGAAAAWAGDLPTSGADPSGGQHRGKWPEAADRAANPKAYMTPEELAAYLEAERQGRLADFISTRPPGGEVVDVPIPG